MTKNVVIIVMAVIIFLLLWALDPREWVANLTKGTTSEKIQVHKDSVIVATAQIEAIQARERSIIKRMREDSIARIAERAAHKREITHYKRRLAEISFDGTTSLELDSIRGELYPPGDSAFIVAGPDPNYSMPISQARDALEAKAREPLRDSMDAKYEARIGQLETDVDSLQIDCNARLEKKDSVNDRSGIIIRNLTDIVGEHEKKERRRRKWGWLRDVGIGVAAFFAGRGTKN